PCLFEHNNQKFIQVKLVVNPDPLRPFFGSGSAIVKKVDPVHPYLPVAEKSVIFLFIMADRKPTLAHLEDDDVDFSSNVDSQELEGEGPEQAATSSKLARPPMKEIDTNTEAIIFQTIDLDFYIGDDEDDQTQPIVRMFGVTKGGNSTCCHVYGFQPYFYAQLPDGFDKVHLNAFQAELNQKVLDEIRGNRTIRNAVLVIQLKDCQDIRGFTFNAKTSFLKITVSLPKLVPIARRILETGACQSPGFNSKNLLTYESNVDFEIRFMVDLDVNGCCWIELPASKYKLRTNQKRQSRCQIEVCKKNVRAEISYKDFIVYACENEWADIAPFRVLSFDIECAGRKGVFPEPDKDPVIQIANMVVRQGEKEPFIRNVFTLNSCAPIVGSQVVSCKTEDELLDLFDSDISGFYKTSS
uniref:DNA polymerase delta catalytic subunit n=1 Tax=Romanomermis culicivorax TaxID=13658 RepID=A0A915J562_ROMCU